MDFVAQYAVCMYVCNVCNCALHESQIQENKIMNQEKEDKEHQQYRYRKRNRSIVSGEKYTEQKQKKESKKAQELCNK
jgi:hypothetical protein